MWYYLAMDKNETENKSQPLFILRKIGEKTVLAAEKAGGKLLDAAKNNPKGTAIAGMIAATLLAGFTASTVFDSPSEIISPEDIQPTPIVEMVGMDDALESAPEAEKHKAKKKSVRTSVKEKLSALPAAVRVGVVLPLYILGSVLSSILGGIFSATLAPVLGFILKWLLVALVVFLAGGLVLKAIFPDIPLSRLLTLKNFIRTLIGVAVIAAADKLLPMVFSEYRQWADFVKICLGLIVIISVTVPAATAIIKHRRDRKLALEL